MTCEGDGHSDPWALPPPLATPLHKVDLNFTLSLVQPQGHGYISKKNADLKYWVQLLFNFTPVNVRQV